MDMVDLHAVFAMRVGWMLNSYIIVLVNHNRAALFQKLSDLPQLITTSFKNQLHHISHKHLRICLAKSGFIICIFFY